MTAFEPCFMAMNEQCEPLPITPLDEASLATEHTTLWIKNGVRDMSAAASSVETTTREPSGPFYGRSLRV